MRNWTQKRMAYVLAAAVTFTAMPTISAQAEVVKAIRTLNGETFNLPITVTEALDKGHGINSYISGYIVGYGANGKVYLSSEDGSNTSDLAIVIADSPYVTDKSQTIIVKLAKGDQRSNWGLKSNPSLLGKKVTVKGELGKAYNTTGINICSEIGYSVGENTSTTSSAVTISAMPASGKVQLGTSVKLETTTTGAIWYRTNGSAYQIYDDQKGITINQDTVVDAYVQNDTFLSKTFTFDYTVVEEQTIAEIKAAGSGNVKFSGIVTRISESGLYVDDGTAGMYVYGDRTGDTISVGDEITVEGTLTIYNSLYEIEKGATVTKKTSGNKVVPIELTLSEYISNPDAYESRLICFKDVTLGKVNTSGNTLVTQGNETINIYKIADGVAEGYDTYDVIALGARYGTTYQLTVAMAEDVMPVSGKEVLHDLIMIEGDALQLPTTIKVYENRQLIEKTITWNAQDISAIDINQKGTYLVRGAADGEVLTLKVVILTADQVKISDIQGKSHVSPYKDQSVANIEGIVTTTNGTKGFYMQDISPDGDDETSDGIYVFKSSHGVKPGDIVTVNGKVVEYTSDTAYLATTQIEATNLTVKSEGNDLPDPIIIGQAGRIPPTKVIDNDGFTVYDPQEDGIDFFESVEGMYVQVQNALVTGANYSSTIPVVPDNGACSDGLISPQGGIVISEDNMHAEVITLAKGMYSVQPNVVTGDRFDGNINGVINYYGGTYRLYVSEPLPPVVEHTYDPNVTTSIEETENGLRIASFNVENMGGNASNEKVNGVANAIVTNLKCPDIVTLEEIQDNSGSTDNGIVVADQVYTRIISEIKDLTNHGVNYEYIEIAPEDGQDGGQPGGNIRIGMLYNPERVMLAKAPAGDATTAVSVVKNADGTASLSHNPGRVDPTNSYFSSTRKPLVAEFIFKGEHVFVMGNHLSSKGGDDPLYGANQPPVLATEAKRIEQAKVINKFVKDLLAVDKNAKIVVLGDLNDFYFSAALKETAGDELYNMLYDLPENERFTYVYGGRSQVLDNVLVTKGLEDYTDIQVLNMNSLKSSSEQLSDHDPIIIRINMDQVNDDEVEDDTDKPSDDETEDDTDKPSDDETEGDTDKPSDDETEDDTDKPADDETEDDTDKPSDDETEDDTDKPSDDEIEDDTDKPSDDETNKIPSVGGHKGKGNGGVVTQKPLEEISTQLSGKIFVDTINHWAKEAIQMLAEKGLVVGIDEANFGVKNKLKRGDFGTLLSRVINQEISLKEGTEGELLTRAQMAVMIKEAMVLTGEVVSINYSEALDAFSDLTDCTLEEKEALAYLVEKGILVGQSTKIMAPHAILTRAEMAIVMQRLMA